MSAAAIAPAITGVHPYAEAWPLLGEDELAELADDIAANGLRDAITTYQGLILDGRNRHAACERARVEPHYREFEGDDDEALAFVQSANNARRHQSKSSLAASWALSMLAANKRVGRRWAYGEVNSYLGRNPNDKYQSWLGVIADHSPGLLNEVRDGEKNLGDAHDEAIKVRDAENNRLAEAERLAAEEADAQAFIHENAPDLAARVDGEDLQSYVEARDIWSRRNREEAERIRREKRDKEQREAEERSNAEQRAKTTADAHYRLHALATDEHRARVLESTQRFSGSLPNLHREVFTPDHLRQTAGALQDLANEMEDSNV